MRMLVSNEMYSSPAIRFLAGSGHPFWTILLPSRLALLPSEMVQGCPSLDNPFVGTRVHWTLVFNPLTHSDSYAFSDDRPT